MVDRLFRMPVLTSALVSRYAGLFGIMAIVHFYTQGIIGSIARIDNTRYVFKLGSWDAVFPREHVAWSS